MAKIKGGCLCGAVGFEIDGRISGVGLCHCSVCRRATGMGGTAVAVTAARSLRWSSGEDTLTTFSRSSGWATAFCPTCGSPAPTLHENGKAYLIPAGILEDGEPLRVARHIFVGSRASWDRIADDAPQFEQWPPEESS